MFVHQKYTKMIASKSGISIRKPSVKIPKYLIYEIIDGKPIYYRGYREVLTKKGSIYA